MPNSTKQPYTGQPKGFAVMNRDLAREICSKGGKAAHKYGVAHQWTSEEAAAAGRKGGRASAAAKKLAKQNAA